MVQQLSLFSSINDEAYDLFLATMTTSYGTPAIVFSNLSTVWKPNPDYEIANVNTRNQLMEQTRIKVSKDIPLELITNINGKTIDSKLLPMLNTDTLPVDPILIDKIINNQLTTSIQDDASISNNWAFAISDIPAAGSNRKVSMQTITESVIVETAGPNASLNNFMQELYYISEYQYLTLGVKFHLRHNIIVELQKIWDVTSKKQVTKNGYLIKAYTNASKATNLDQINHGEQQLLNLQKELQGYVDLQIPDRKTMDSRLDFNDDTN